MPTAMGCVGRVHTRVPMHTCVCPRCTQVHTAVPIPHVSVCSAGLSGCVGWGGRCRVGATGTPPQRYLLGHGVDEPDVEILLGPDPCGARGVGQPGTRPCTPPQHPPLL